VTGRIAPASRNSTCDIDFVTTPEDLLQQGVEHHRAGRFAQAQALYQEVLRLDSRQPDAWHLLGVILRDAGQLDDAVHCLTEAIKLRADIASFHVNLAEALRRQGHLREALAAAERGVALGPSFSDAHATLAAVFQSLRRSDEALVEYNRAIELNPTRVDPHYNRAWIWLSRGDYARGFPEYEWRWQRPDFEPSRFPGPCWDGLPLAGRTLAVECEQGLGDTIQFIRYVRLLREKGDRVLVVAQPQVVPLLRESGISDVFAPGTPLPEFHEHIGLLSLPGLLGTTLDSVPAQVPYLSARADLVGHWKARLDAMGGFKVGINWQGNPNSPHEPGRSMPLAHFQHLAREGVSLISLQKGFGVEQIPAANKRFRVVEFGAELDERNGPFMDTAAVMQNLELVVTSDTVTAHLAGALGVPVWVALAHDTDWRWMLAREDSPWYPSMRLFRQSQPGQWSDVFERIGAELKKLLEQQRG
jgi:Tfp pilus assembly protein PilF